jgi:hypothetical protein
VVRRKWDGYEATLSHLKPQQGLSERYQRRALDVTLACKLTHVYGKYHLAMLHRQLAMSEEQTTCIFPSMQTRYCGTSRGRCVRWWKHTKNSVWKRFIDIDCKKTIFCLKNLAFG